MKKLLILLFVFIFDNSYSQILIRNLQGEPIFSPLMNDNAKNVLLNLNTGAQSIGADYLFNTRSKNPTQYTNYRIGLSAKPTEGVASLISNGQFSPSLKLSFAITRIQLFANSMLIKQNLEKIKFNDWLTISSSINYEKNKLLRRQSSFNSQIIDTNFTGYSLGFDYNISFGNDEQDYFNFQIVYNRRNNYDELTSFDIIDRRSIFDSATSIQRSFEKKTTAREGNYMERNASLIQISYTHLPKNQFKYLKSKDGSDSMKVLTKTEFRTNGSKIDTINIETETSEPVTNPNFKSLKFGYSFFYSVLAMNGFLPESKLGASLFIISPDKDNNLIPRLAFNCQFNDIFDLQQKNNGIFKRFQVGISATFSL